MKYSTLLVQIVDLDDSVVKYIQLHTDSIIIRKHFIPKDSNFCYHLLTNKAYYVIRCSNENGKVWNWDLAYPIIADELLISYDEI